jgi:phospholipase/carboxylesterase
MLTSELVPAKDQPSRHLMVVLHGLGDSTEGYRWLPQTLALPSLNYLLVNAPDNYYTGYSWFEFAGDPQPGIERSRRMLFELLDAQRAAGFPTEQTLLFGFSQGCLMTWEAGLRYPHRFAGLIGISGWAHEHAMLLQERSPVALQQRFLITHGPHDPLVPFASVKQQVQELRAAGLQIDWREFAKAHTIAGEEELKVIRDFAAAQLVLPGETR